MKYTGSEQFSHDQTPKIGVLVTNLGTPAAPEKAALRPYLKQFLSDPRVVEVPRLLWWLILNGVILNIRPARSAVSYRTVWTDEGSPLLIHTRNQASALQEKLGSDLGEPVLVDFAMRYGQPAIDDVVQSMLDRGVRKLLVLPLYPLPKTSSTAAGCRTFALSPSTTITPLTLRPWPTRFACTGKPMAGPTS